MIWSATEEQSVVLCRKPIMIRTAAMAGCAAFCGLIG
jgi:hypothetical protein